ncbi:MULTISPECIES: cupredoxin domain-containing protein [Rhodanobacter]|uniref:cupredoxin domain-containing protein n=1 Tax=Rhodanobacter TaxID=75309 RepID=UPI0004288A1E|nr:MULTISPECIES: cupredoxin domain-containing protein [Rhodanobacter]UJJ49855.1 cupredoxin domain-containing protein [Rhodanobacter denitrificans]UJJ57953.1 cupredoxin domain-containing protein [Rhodanobacter denitrificans]
MLRLLPFVFALSLPLLASAADTTSYTLTLKDHRYQPSELRIPADTRVRLELVNQDASPEEFESDDFPVEKIVMPNSRTSLLIGPFKPGHYRFYGDFHQPTAQGTLVVE